jgi:hypothetical protein
MLSSFISSVQRNFDCGNYRYAQTIKTVQFRMKFSWKVLNILWYNCISLFRTCADGTKEVRVFWNSTTSTYKHIPCAPIWYAGKLWEFRASLKWWNPELVTPRRMDLKPRPRLEQITRVTGYSGVTVHWVALVAHCPPWYSEKGWVFPLGYGWRKQAWVYIDVESHVVLCPKCRIPNPDPSTEFIAPLH